MSDEGVHRYECTLTSNLIENSSLELNEVISSREDSIQFLRDKVSRHKGLKCPMNSSFLLRFLRAKKFDHEKAYQLLLNYYAIRNKYSKILKELAPSETEKILDSGIVCLLPVKDKLNRKILYFRPGKWIPAEFPMIEIVRVNLLTFEEAIKNEETQVCGLVAVANFADIGWRHLMDIDLNYIKVNVEIVQDSFPMLFKGLHLINEPALIGYIYAIVKPILKEKTMERLTFHGSSLDSLHKSFGKECLPQELGGYLPPGDELAKTWKQTLIDDEQMFQEMKQYGITTLESNT